MNEGNLKIVSILIKSNANVNCLTFDKKSPLHISCTQGYFDISKLLIENGATIGILDSEKNNPLHICAKAGHSELLKFLLDRHPQADSKNIYGKTPIEMATSSKIKLVLQEYLTKNINKYHYIRIHKINNKSANNFILNYKGNIPLERYYIALVSNIHTTTQEIRNGNHMKNQSEFRVSNPNNKSYSKEKLCNKNFSNNTNVKINVTVIRGCCNLNRLQSAIDSYRLKIQGRVQVFKVIA